MIAAPVNGAPAKAQLTGSLLAAALPGGSSARWENGVSWRPERCFTAAGFAPCDPTPGIPPYEPVGPQQTYPLGFRVRDVCTTLGGELDAERVRRQVEAATSFHVARELWTGVLSTANPVDTYVNPFLADDPTVVATTASGVLARLGALEQAAMEDAYGQQVFLHVPAHVVLPIANELERRGELLYTPLGNVVVADAGYPGSGPADTGTEWAYSTGPVTVHLSPVEVMSDPAQTIDRSINRQEIWGMRLFAAAYDPCTIFAIDTSASA
jgi:hypothetical protein